MKGRVFWLDDEPQRLGREFRLLEKDGWRVRNSRSVQDAATILAEEPFDVILLDQDLPLTGTLWTLSIWSGCGLLYWIRGRFDRFREIAPESVIENWSELDSGDLNPLLENMKIPALVISGFYDREVIDAMTNATDMDKMRLLYFAKPVQLDAVLRALNTLIPSGDPR